MNNSTELEDILAEFYQYSSNELKADVSSDESRQPQHTEKPAAVSDIPHGERQRIQPTVSEPELRAESAAKRSRSSGQKSTGAGRAAKQTSSSSHIIITCVLSLLIILTAAVAVHVYMSSRVSKSPSDPPEIKLSDVINRSASEFTHSLEAARQES